jgi:hypothetical protein
MVMMAWIIDVLMKGHNCRRSADRPDIFVGLCSSRAVERAGDMRVFEI